MKKYFYLSVVLVLISCTDQLVKVEEVTGEKIDLAPASEINALIEKARWGDGEAYVKLADSYRDGKGVKQDFISMLAMASFAENYGGIKHMEDYISSLPTDSEYKIVIDAMETFSRGGQNESLTMAENLIAQGRPEGYTIKGIILTEQGKKEEGKSFLDLAAERGSGFAELYLCIPDLLYGKNPDIDKLTALADVMPIANTCLGRIYSGRDDQSLKDEKLAAYYYMRADKKACLGKSGARWLLGYLRSGGKLELSETDIERLEILADMRTPLPEIIRHNDPNLEAGITELLQEDIESSRMWSKAIIYIVEANTGKIKANVAYELKGNELVPYTDTYDQEQSVMECGSTYLALLSSGNISPQHVFDTRHGIYGNVRDHNWNRGGYGTISLERALEVRSQVALTMAKEHVFGSNTSEFDEQINFYLAGKPNSATGILTFYNAIANGGKMVELVSEGEDGIVIQEQIAEPQYIKMLQTGLEQCVSQGIMHRAGRSYVKVSACGRTFVTQGDQQRMELCGYFPSEAPLYTIMVILEKEGQPASTGVICESIFAEIVDLLVHEYKIEPFLSRQYEDVDEIIEIIDSAAIAY